VNPSRKGRRLADVLPPRWPRWGSLALSTFATSAYVGITLYFVAFTDELIHRKWMALAVGGSIGLLCLVFWVRDTVMWLIVGDTVVEFSKDSVHPGESVEFFVLQERDHSWLKQLDARIVCRRQVQRGIIAETVSLPLGTAMPVDGRRTRAQLQGTVAIPADAEPSLESEALKVRWSVEVRAFFGPRRFVEDHPFVVKEKPPSGA
jgi:hypothetical protein